jgi:hypothetical protein
MLSPFDVQADSKFDRLNQDLRLYLVDGVLASALPETDESSYWCGPATL